MIRAIVTVATVLSVCVAVGQAGEGVSHGSDPGDGAVSEPDSLRNEAGLVSVVQLNEGQLESLRSLSFEFEDEIFPLMQDSWEKEWELRRLYRSKDADESRGDMIRQEIEALYERIYNAGVRHRERARALLSSQQVSVLGRLEMALELSAAAKEAVCANLISTPGDYEYVPGLGALFGFQGGFGPCEFGLGLPPMFRGHPEVDDKTDAVPLDKLHG